MILHYVDNETSNTVIDSDEETVSRVLNEMITEFEESGLYLIKEHNGSYEFATTTHGWHCALIVASGYVDQIN